MINVDSYLYNGYHFGNVREIFQDMSIFYNFAKAAKKLTENKSADQCFYINDIAGQNNIYSREVPIDKLVDRRQLIKNNNFTVDQQWWNYDLFGGIDFKTLTAFRTEISRYMISIYNSNGLTMENIAHGDNITVYEDGDFSKIHQDGQNIGRYAAILIYFGENYNNGGGEFMIGADKILPVIGNFVVLDFTKNNIQHGVRVIKNGFKRITYLDFVANIDMQKNIIGL
jgi:hypothetical protein